MTCIAAAKLSSADNPGLETAWESPFNPPSATKYCGGTPPPSSLPPPLIQYFQKYSVFPIQPTLCHKILWRNPPPPPPSLLSPPLIQFFQKDTVFTPCARVNHCLSRAQVVPNVRPPPLTLMSTGVHQSPYPKRGPALLTIHCIGLVCLWGPLVVPKHAHEDFFCARGARCLPWRS